jgi:lysophospholipase L1-like esterase
MRGHVDPALAEGADVEPPRAVERMRSDTPVMTSDPNRRPTEATVIILGASYAAGWNPTLERMAFTNSGVGGQQSFEMLARFSKDVVDRKPRAVILWGFINDVFRAPRAESAAALARVRESYITMLAEARRHGIAPILATEVTVGVRAGLRETLAGFVGRLLGKQSYDEYVNRHVMDTNAWLRELARREGVLLLDFERVLAGRGGRRRAEYTASDGSHITAPAYDALTAYAKSILPGQLAEHAGTLPSGGQQDPLRP